EKLEINNQASGARIKVNIAASKMTKITLPSCRRRIALSIMLRFPVHAKRAHNRRPEPGSALRSTRPARLYSRIPAVGSPDHRDNSRELVLSWRDRRQSTGTPDRTGQRRQWS